MRSKLKKLSCVAGFFTGLFSILFSGALFAQVVQAAESDSILRFKRVRALHLDLYSQSGYEQRTKNVVNQSRMTTAVFELPFHSRFHIGTAFETDTRSTRGLIYNDNYFAPLVGLSWVNYDIGIGARIEELLSYRENSALQPGWKPETRAVLYHYQFGNGRNLQPRLRTFFESYGELAYKSMFTRNAFLQYLGKAGVRQQISNRIFADVYPELTLKRDAEGLEYENLSEVRAAARVLYQQATFSTFLSLSFQTPVYFGDDDYKSPVSANFVVSAEL